MVRNIIKNIPGIRNILRSIRFRCEYRYDRKFFENNYSHSKTTQNKTGYNMLLIAHALEKGMSNKNPRRFGVQKVEELMELISLYESYGSYKNDFAYINAINVLRGYTGFYEEKKWTDADEYKKVCEFIKSRKNVNNMNVGSFTLFKKDFENDAKINYHKFLLSRHSVREFKREAIQETDLIKAVEDAILTPSACNRQMCKVYYVTDEDRRKKLIEMAQGFGGFEKETINPLVVTFDANANYFIGERNQGWFNAGLFSLNLVNSLHAHGIGSCFCQFGNTVKEEEKLKDILDIPKNERIAVLIACGYYVDECRIPYSPRKEIRDIYKKI